MSEIKRNIEEINYNIKSICNIYNISTSKIKLICVSKYHSIDKIKEVIKLGYLDFAENYLSEIKEKWIGPECEFVENEFKKCKINYIGSLQSNKIKSIVKVCDAIYSLASIEHAEIIKKELDKQNKKIEIFIQVNIANESSKSGISVNELESLIEYVKNNLSLEISGLMCIPPLNESSLIYFYLLAEISKKHNFRKISIGMSNDYKLTMPFAEFFDELHLRIGSAIFGERDAK